MSDRRRSKATHDSSDDDDDDDADEVDGNRSRPATPLDVCEYLVRALVDDPDAVRIERRTIAAAGARPRVHVAPGDMGRVIGRRGRIAQAIRTVVRAAAVRDGVEVDVDFVD